MGSTTLIGAAISNNPTRGRESRIRPPSRFYRAFTFYGGPFEATCSRRGPSTADPKTTIREPRTELRILGLSFALFIRHYWGHPGWFLFLRLLICLNSAGGRARSEVGETVGRPFEPIGRKGRPCSVVARDSLRGRGGTEAPPAPPPGSRLPIGGGEGGGKGPSVRPEPGRRLSRSLRWVWDGAADVPSRGPRSHAAGRAGFCIRRSDERAPAARPEHGTRSKFRGFAPVAIRPNYRTLLRSSSIDEPRYPLL